MRRDPISEIMLHDSCDSRLLFSIQSGGFGIFTRRFSAPGSSFCKLFEAYSMLIHDRCLAFDRVQRSQGNNSSNSAHERQNAGANQSRPIKPILKRPDCYFWWQRGTLNGINFCVSRRARNLLVSSIRNGLLCLGSLVLSRWMLKTTKKDNCEHTGVGNEGYFHGTKYRNPIERPAGSNFVTPRETIHLLFPQVRSRYARSSLRINTARSGRSKSYFLNRRNQSSINT